MNRSLLLEIGLEELPARFITGSTEQLAERIKGWFDDTLIAYGDISIFSTPRRLTVIVNDVVEKQQDRMEEVRGPSVKAAKDEQGNWSKAALGFAKGQGVKLDDLYVDTVKGVEYVFAKKEYKGEEVKNLLPAKLTEIIQSMTFPKNMRWGAQELRYVRPIRWIVALFGTDIIEIEVTGVKSSNITRGHRFLGKEVIIPSPEEYEELLAEQFVIVNPVKRQKQILEQIAALEKDRDWHVIIDKELLREVTNLVEYPTVLFGSFKEEFLELPSEVLITTMKEHQRYFPVEDKEGSLLPFFITVRNGNDKSLGIVRKGNEKVLTARLADAKFFYLEDQKIGIDAAVSKLEHIVFHENLGTLGDKVRRIKEISVDLANLLQLERTTVNYISRTAEICKFDLVTNMVYEFPELQGIMGERYAKIHGEATAVATGIVEHYLPKFSGDKLGQSIIGQLVSIVDKIDNIVGAFSVGKIPTGSQDPLGLRRQAAGIVQLLHEKIQALELNTIFELSLKSYEAKGLLKRSKEEILFDLTDFFKLRIKNLLQEQGIRYDVIDAVLESDINNIKNIVDKASIINKSIEDRDFKSVVESFTRVMNIAAKANNSLYNPALFKEDAEMALYNQFNRVQVETAEANNAGNMLENLKTLKGPIDSYFDQVMIMADDEEIRQNRLGLMSAISKLIQPFADFNKLVFS